MAEKDHVISRELCDGDPTTAAYYHRRNDDETLAKGKLEEGSLPVKTGLSRIR